MSEEPTKWPSNLKSVEDVALRLGLTKAQVVTLCDDGYIPHFRCGEGVPMFKITEVMEWAAENIMTRCKGKPLPKTPINVCIQADHISHKGLIPESIRQIPGLRQINRSMFGSGIYFLCLRGVLIYVGQSRNVGQRLEAHVRSKDFDTVYFLPWPSDDLDRVEGALIRALDPIGNGRVSGSERPFAPGRPHDDSSIIAHLLP